MKSKEFGRILGELKLVLVLVPIVAMVTSAVISMFVLTPVYQSTATVIVLKDQMTPYSEINMNTLMLNQKLLSTYSALVKSRAVAEEVIDNTGINLSPQELSARITVAMTADTVMSISAADANPTMAALMANAVAQALSGKVYKVMNVKNIEVLDPAIPSAVPVSPNAVMNVLMAGIMGLLLTVVIIFVREYLDDTIREADEVEDYLKLPVLGQIPGMSLQAGAGRRAEG